jgi:hypothetical protein
MSPEQLRQALTELKGERSCSFVFAGIPTESGAVLTVNNAMLIPAEADNLVKLTDGQSIYALDAERVVYIRIGAPALEK